MVPVRKLRATARGVRGVSDGLGVVVALLVMVQIGLTLWQMWPDGESDLDTSNPVGFTPYDPEEHEDDEEPWEV